MADVQAQPVKDTGSNTAVATQPSAKTVKGDKDADGILDVFTSVKVGDNPIIKLSRDLGDVSVYSLLEQTQQLADQIRRKR